MFGGNYQQTTEIIGETKSYDSLNSLSTIDTGYICLRLPAC